MRRCLPPPSLKISIKNFLPAAQSCQDKLQPVQCRSVFRLRIFHLADAAASTKYPNNWTNHVHTASFSPLHRQAIVLCVSGFPYKLTSHASLQPFYSTNLGYIRLALVDSVCRLCHFSSHQYFTKASLYCSFPSCFLPQAESCVSSA